MPLRLIIALFCCECENEVNDSNILTFLGLDPDLTIENVGLFGVFLVMVGFIRKEMLIRDICNWDQNKSVSSLLRFDFIRFINDK
jgi:hypothetical protein